MKSFMKTVTLTTTESPYLNLRYYKWLDETKGALFLTDCQPAERSPPCYTYTDTE